MTASGNYTITWTAADGLDIFKQGYLADDALAYTTGDGTDDASMVFTGTINDINAALDGLVFTPTASYSGPAGITITTDDQGNSGSGGAKTDTDTADIVVGNAPMLDLDPNNSSAGSCSGYVATFTEDAGAVLIIDTDAALSDPDSANLESLTVTITNLLDGADEVLSYDTSGTSINAAYNAGVLSLTGTDTIGNYQQVLRTVTYNNSSQDPDTTARVITFTANDGTYDSNTGKTTVTMVAVNDDPTNGWLPSTMRPRFQPPPTTRPSPRVGPRPGCTAAPASI